MESTRRGQWIMVVLPSALDDRMCASTGSAVRHSAKR